MLCGSRHRSISRGSPALNKTPAFWVTYPPALRWALVDPRVVQTGDVHHAVRFPSTQHVHREPCSE